MKALALTRFLLSLILSVTFVMPAAATIFWSEDFENHLWNGSQGNPWDTSSCIGGFWGGTPPYQDGCDPAISTDFATSATHSLKGVFTGLDSGRYFDRSYPQTDEIWVRTMYRTRAFTYNNVGTKHFHLGANLYPNFWINNNAGRRDMMIYSQNAADGQCGSGDGSIGAAGSESNPQDCLYYANAAVVNLSDDRWYCVEVHIKYNTPGVADGIAQMWIDGTQTVNYTNRRFRGTLDGANNTFRATFNFTRIFVQHGVGEMYYDDFAVGNTRIGCGSGSLPGTPANLTVS